MKPTRHNLRIRMLVMALFVAIASQAQDTGNTENEFASWYSFKLQKKLGAGWHLFINPEIRLNSLEVDKYLMETGVKYKINKYLNTTATYRFTADQKSDHIEYSHRMAFDVKGKTKFGNFEPELRLRYSTITDFDEDPNNKYLRYKALVAYDIPKNRLTPYVAAEAFQELSDDGFTKMRYSLGADYKLKKNNYIGLSYKLDYYLHQYKNKHIIGINYKLKF
ncbi:MAG: DUF2490 domain-containing protein [Reichenbachiella sp.]|uniref:DUF2490 domain-containing protein n=1 Tax=Reichenbachiella sp. TaxID=2184521 RepID=UPI003263257D